MGSRWVRVLGVVIVVLMAIGAVGYVWLDDLADAMPEAAPALASDQAVTVATDPWLTFTPMDPASTGFILYPGARVEPAAYAPAAHAIAEAGFLTVITPMPFGLAVLDPDAADAVIDAHPEIDRWVVGGHSLGGAMAAQYADGHPAIDGLALWAAYPAQDRDLSDADLQVASIHASEDGLATTADIEASAARLPTTTFVEIEGGNHAGFGWYGDQDGDGEASIGRLDQQEQVVGATIALLEAVGAG